MCWPNNNFSLELSTYTHIEMDTLLYSNRISTFSKQAARCIINTYVHIAM